MVPPVLAPSERALDVRPTSLIESRDHRTDASALRERNVIEVEGAGRRHAVVGGQYDLGRQPLDRSRRRDHDHLVERLDDVVASQDQDGAALVTGSEGVPAALTALQ